MPDPTSSTVFLARQPIFDADARVVAYELLFRAGNVDYAQVGNADEATAQVMVNSFLEIGLDLLVGEQPAFINVTRGFLLGEHLRALPPERVVLEILEDVQVDPALIRAVEELAVAGYRVALDDFVFQESLRPLVELAEFIKLDVRAQDRDSIARQVELLRHYPARLLAEKVETQEEFAHFRGLGFDYFQGYFLSRPTLFQATTIPQNRLAVVQLMAKVQDPGLTATDLEQVIARDLGLSYKLLRYINSAFFALPRKVDSIHHALIYLGHKAIQRWAMLLALSNLDDKPRALLHNSLFRAHMCEQLAEGLGFTEPTAGFTVGLFSNLDALMDRPMAELLEQLPLSEAVTHALLRREGVLGRALACTEAYERGTWDQLHCTELAIPFLRRAYLESLAWADRAAAAIPAAAPR